MNKFAQHIALAVGLPVKEVGGHSSFRIGEATELADAMGAAEQLKARGCWDGIDLGSIYVCKRHSGSADCHGGRDLLETYGEP